MRIGAVAKALLFTIGKFLIGLYLGTSSIASSFGAAGSVVILLVWIYYSSCILFFGAEFTKVYARKFGSGIVPNSRAVLVSDLLRAKPVRRQLHDNEGDAVNLPSAGSSLHFFVINEIRLFVSGYQRHFWISARHATEALFRALDEELHVELFLVGILREDTADQPSRSVLSRRIAALTRRSSAVSKKRRRSSRTTGV